MKDDFQKLSQVLRNIKISKHSTERPLPSPDTFYKFKLNFERLILGVVRFQIAESLIRNLQWTTHRLLCPSHHDMGKYIVMSNTTVTQYTC